MERVADESRLSRKSGKGSHLAVRSDAAAWDSSHDGIDAVVRRAATANFGRAHLTAATAEGT